MNFPLPLISNCQGCDACCMVQAVGELGKPYYTRCQHENGKGCEIYGKHPQSCREYTCFWNIGVKIGGKAFNPDERPDKSGVIMGIAPNMGKLFLEISEVRPGLDMEETLDKYAEFCSQMVSNPTVPLAGLMYVRYGSKICVTFPLQQPYPDPTPNAEGSTFKRLLGSRFNFLVFMESTTTHEAKKSTLPPFEYMLSNPTLDEVRKYFEYGDMSASQIAILVMKNLMTKEQFIWMQSQGLDPINLVMGDRYTELNYPKIREIFKDWNAKLGFLNFYG